MLRFNWAKLPKPNKNKYIWGYDPNLKKRTKYLLISDFAISTESNHRIKLSKEDINTLKNYCKTGNY